MNLRPLVLAIVVVAGAVPLARQQAGSSAPPSRLWAAQTAPKQITLVWTRVERAGRGVLAHR